MYIEKNTVEQTTILNRMGLYEVQWPSYYTKNGKVGDKKKGKIK